MEKPEVLQLQFPEQTVPVPYHSAVIATDLKPRPVDVHLEDQLSYLLNNIFQDQVFQDFPLCALHICLEDINLQQKHHYCVKMRDLAVIVSNFRDQACPFNNYITVLRTNPFANKLKNLRTF